MDESWLVGSPGSAAQRYVLAFRLEGLGLALPIEPVAQIIPMVTLTPFPQASDTVAGVINVHGTLVSVVDLRRHLGLPLARPQLYTPIILARLSGQMVGLIVDEVTDVLALADNRVVPAADVLPRELGEVPAVRGLANTENGVVMILDPDHLLPPEQAQALARAAEYLQQHPELVAAERGP